MPTPLIMGEFETAKLHALRELAVQHPVQMVGLLERIGTPAGKRQHMAQMDRQSVEIPVGFLVTFSVEIGHPGGTTCRHMSMSSPVHGRVPSPEAVQWVCSELGFTGPLDDGTHTVWIEELKQGRAVNVVQPIAVADPSAYPRQ